MSPAADGAAARLTVAAVVVAHDGAEWLPGLLSALSSSTRLPDVLVAVDTGSLDDSARVLRSEPAVNRVVVTARSMGFGAAVATGIAAADESIGGASSDVRDSQWVWLLHDDCAPAPDALERLLEVATSQPGVAAVGCRIRGWPQARRLLEIGVTITGTGHRETGLEPGEHDQGQHDEVRDVLAVSSAGMLVRRQIWDDLGGFDPRLPLFRDDCDFGWRASAAGHRVVIAGPAVMFHAEASSRGVRDVSCTTPSPHRADRRGALVTLLANCRTAAVPVVYLRLLVGSLLRALGYLLAKLPRAAWDEVAAAADVLGRPWRLVAARAWRRRRRGTRAVGVRHLLPPWWTPYANGLDAVLARFTGTARDAVSSVESSARRLRTPGDDSTSHPAAGVARHPLLVLSGALTAASVIATRGLWGSGFLQGGALLPAPDGAADWWRLYTESSHAVGLGSSLDTAPYVALLALPATLLLGKAWLLVDVLLLLAAPLAGIGAWAASGALVRAVGVRIWMACAYGLVPIVTGAVTSGHVGTVVAALVLPWLARSGCRLLDITNRAGWQHATATGVLLAVATAFAPICWPIGAAVGLLAMAHLVLARRLLRAVQWALALLIPIVLLLPWSWTLLTDPARLLTEAGILDVPGASITGSAWQLALARVGAVGQAPWEVTAGIFLAALVALLRRDTRARVAAAWLVGACALAAAALMARGPVALPLDAGEAYPWLGVPVIVASAAAIAAAGLAADGLRSFVGGGSFGWRQPIAVVGVAAGVAALVASFGWWLGAAPHGALHRGVATPVPAYVIDAMASRSERVLVLSTSARSVAYQVLAGDGVRLGDESVLSADADPAFAKLVGDLLSAPSPRDVSRLAARGIGYVVLPSPQDGGAVARLDALAGISRTSSNQALLSAWQVAAPRLEAEGAGTSRSRAAELIAQLLLWLTALVLAAPAGGRHPFPASEPSRDLA